MWARRLLLVSIVLFFVGFGLLRQVPAFGMTIITWSFFSLCISAIIKAVELCKNRS